MARKRTPTKEINGQNGNKRQSKDNTTKKEEKKASVSGDSQHPPKLRPKISPVVILTVFMSIFTAVVCYIIYPKFTDFAVVSEKSIPNLRTFIESLEKRDISKRDISQNGFESNMKSSLYSFMEKSRDGGDDTELERIAEEIMRLHAHSRNSPDEDELSEAKDSQTETSSSENVTLNETVLNIIPAQLQTDQDNNMIAVTNDENSDTSRSADSVHSESCDRVTRINRTEETDQSMVNVNKAARDTAEDEIRYLDRDKEEIKHFPLSKETVSKHDIAKENVNDGAKIMKTEDTKTNKYKEIKPSVAFSKAGEADKPNQLLLKQGKKKTGPIILTAENPHIQLSFSDISGATKFHEREGDAAEETSLSTDNDIVSKIKNQVLNNETKVKKAKNIETPSETKPSITSKSDTAGATMKPSPNDGRKKSGPIFLSAENPHVTLDMNEIKSAAGQQHGEIKLEQTKKQKSAKQSSVRGADREEVIRTNGKNKSTNQSKRQKEKADTGNTEHHNSNLSEKQNVKPVKVKTEKKIKSQSDAKSDEKSSSSNAKKSSDKEFRPSFQKTFSTKKIFYGGRRIAPVELLHQKPSNSSVKVFLFDDFLSEQECEGLMRAHDSHVRAYTKPPILCFDSVSTLRKHVQDAGKNVKVTPKVFTSGTKCVNVSFSLQLQEWLNSNWSYSTAFYPGESKFSTNVAVRMQKSMGLKTENGGKFQITSYPLGKAYKTHTDCTLGGVDKRDRVVSVLMYLNDAEEGGETTFPELGIWVKPRRGRAIVWNNMSPAGVCEHHSRHAASLVKQGKKYILIRWYYYKSFPGLGHRPSPPSLPQREDDQAMVTCDDYNNGSCRWYDEWTYEHLTDYQQNKLHIS